MSDKIRVRDTLASISPYESFTTIADTFTACLEKQKSGEYTDLSVESDLYDNSWEIVGYRLETDAEYNKRQKQFERVREMNIKNKERTRIANEKRDRKEYERLKKKFEKKDNDAVVDIIETVTKHEHAWVNFGGVYHLGNPEQWQECATCKEKRKL